MKNKIIKRIGAGIVIGIFCGFLSWLISAVLFENFFSRLEGQSYDKRLKLITHSSSQPIKDIIIVDIDQRSIEKLGNFYFWPRTYWAKFIDLLVKEGVSSIGMNLIFEPISRFPEEDKDFQRAIFESGLVCSAFSLLPADPEYIFNTDIEEPAGLDYERFIYHISDSLLEKLKVMEVIEPGDPSFLNASQTAGYLNFFPDGDGVVRRTPLLLNFNSNAYASVPFQMVLKSLGVNQIDLFHDDSNLVIKTSDNKQVKIPIDDHCQMILYYIGYPHSFRFISFYDVLMNFNPTGIFKDKIVLVGSSLANFSNLPSTPLATKCSEMEINATIIYQILKNNFIKSMAQNEYFLMLILCGLISGTMLVFLRPVWGVFLSLILISLMLVAGVMALDNYAYWLPLVGPIETILFCFAATAFYQYSFLNKQKRRIIQIFSPYLSPLVLKKMVKNPERIMGNGENINCSVLFTNLNGFSSLRERFDSKILIEVINEYLTKMGDIIIENQGMFNYYPGNAILGIFGAPIELHDHAEKVCNTALLMKKCLTDLFESREEKEISDMHLRIGINTGEMVFGNMGSKRQVNYSVMGDAVNFAFRLEDLNKLYDTQIIVGESTYEKIKSEFLTRPLDILRIKGHKRPITTYELIGKRDDRYDSNLIEMLNQYNNGFECYLSKDWEMAQNHFRRALQLKTDDGPSRIYLLRCQEFLSHPPGDDWDGVFFMKT